MHSKMNHPSDSFCTFFQVYNEVNGNRNQNDWLPTFLEICEKNFFSAMFHRKKDGHRGVSGTKWEWLNDDIIKMF